MGMSSAYYWASGKIVHYLEGKNVPFRMLSDIPNQIRKSHGITEDLEDLLLNPKNHLSVHTWFCSYNDYVFLNSPFCQFCMKTNWLHWCITKYSRWVINRGHRTNKRWK